MLVQFAALGRQPHAWLSPPFDSPPDLEQRLVVNGFEDMGRGVLMVARGATAAARALAERVHDPAVRLERASGRQADDARATAEAIVGVLLAAFAVGPERRESLVEETVATLGDERFTQYVVRVDGIPAAVARRATFDGISYLSSIGTLPSARNRGLGRFVTATAVVDAVRAGSELIHLGVWDENHPARRLYEQLGFEASGGPCPDMLLVG